MSAKKNVLSMALVIATTMGMNNLSHAADVSISMTGLIQAPACTLNSAPENLQVSSEEALTAAEQPLQLEMSCPADVSAIPVTFSGASTDAEPALLTANSESIDNTDSAVQLSNGEQELQPGDTAAVLTTGENKLHLTARYQPSAFSEKMHSAAQLTVVYP
ncbi:fimbrial protein [Franconibacter pulveris]|jgi:type 1 fimbria pilin